MSNSHHIDPRVYAITGEIDEETAGQVLRVLRNSRGQDVRLYLNTGGGCVRNAMEICSMIKAHGNVSIVAFGECMSAGIWILASAKHVSATEDCELMVHYGEETNESLTDKKRNNRMYRWMRSVLKEKVNVKQATVTRWMNKDKYFTAEEALKVGLVDAVISWSYDDFRKG